MIHTVTVNHNFETAHRLPVLGGKCANLHGHSWRAAWTFAGTPDADGIIADFAALKGTLRGWVDTCLDHGTMLGHDDVLVGVLDQLGSRAFVFGRDANTTDLAWPTVENVAVLLWRVAEELTGLTPARVAVTETATNTAEVVA